MRIFVKQTCAHYSWRPELKRIDKGNIDQEKKPLRFDAPESEYTYGLLRIKCNLLFAYISE